MSEKKQMDPEQAISLIDQVCAQVSLNRENHQRVLVALGVMRNAINNGHDPKDVDGGKDDSTN